MADVFVSYSRQDKARAAQFVQLLEGYGWDVFWDQETRAGTIWPKVLEDELGLARCLLVLWTANSVASRWVRIEAYEALQNDKLLPVRLENVKPPMEFRQTQTFDLLGWTGDQNDPRLDHLIADFCVLTKLSPRKGTVGPATLDVVRTLVPATLGTSTFQAPATLSGAPDFSGHVVPTYRSVGLAAPTLVPTETAHEPEQPRSAETAIGADTISLSIPAPSTVGGTSATTSTRVQSVESGARVESGALDIATGEGRIGPVPWGRRVSLGLGAAAVAIAVVWLGGRALKPSEVSKPEPFKSQVFAREAQPEPPAAAATMPVPTSGSTAATTAAVTPPPTPMPSSTPTSDVSRPTTVAKPSVARPPVPSNRCIEITERFQQTGQITAADRQFLSSKECSR
jgi:hypothetical protein